MSKLLINPYKVGPPVMGADFYGRSELLSKVQKALQTSNVVLLQGQRRIGKTSFLKQLSVFLKSAEGMQAFQAPLVPVIFDIQRYVQDTLPQFQWHLAEAIARELQLTAPSLPEWEANHALFQDVWLPQVYEKLGDRDLAILVDEFDNLEGQSASQAMQTLIPFLGQLVSSETRLKWVLTLGRQTGKLPIQYDPIVAPATKITISFLSPSETRELIERPSNGLLTYYPTAIERIYKLTNGQPHLTQALASEIFQSIVLEQERQVVEAADVDAVISQTLEAYENAISSIVKVPPIEERVLAAVACATEEGTFIKRDQIVELLLKNQVSIGIDELRAAIRSLIEWEILKGNIGRVKVCVELLRIWLAANLSLESSQETNLSIQYELAQNHFALAEEARKAGKYSLAIKSYEEVLSYIPKHTDALRGLVESTRLNGELPAQVRNLNTLYLYDRSILSELIEALINYAGQLEEKREYCIAVEQYRTLMKLRDNAKWRKSIEVIYHNISNEMELYLEVAEETFSLIEFQDKLSIQDRNFIKLKSLVEHIENLLEQVELILAKNSDLDQTRRLQETFITYERKSQNILNRLKALEAIVVDDWSLAINLLSSANNLSKLDSQNNELMKFVLDKHLNKQITNVLSYPLLIFALGVLMKSDSVVLTVFTFIGGAVLISTLSSFLAGRVANLRISFSRARNAQFK